MGKCGRKRVSWAGVWQQAAGRPTARFKNRLVLINVSGHKLVGTKPDGGVKSDNKGKCGGAGEEEADESAPPSTRPMRKGARGTWKV